MKKGKKYQIQSNDKLPGYQMALKELIFQSNAMTSTKDLQTIMGKNANEQEYFHRWLTQQIGIGVHIPETKINFSSKTIDNLQICTTELLAIDRGITLGIENQINNKTIIISDTLSAI